jgi:Zn-dependent M16 (insulinase) family peptidase
MFALVRETLDSARFDELQRLRELLSQMRARRDQSITGSGHSLAMAAASSRMSPSRLLSHTLSGLEGIRRTRALEKGAAVGRGVRSSSRHGWEQLHEAMRNRSAPTAAGRRPRITTDDATQALAGLLARHACRCNYRHLLRSACPYAPGAHQIWQTSTQVNFCAKAYPTVPIGIPTPQR